MVVGAFPAAKLGVLALKQISKPVANVIKNRAKNNPIFRKYVCMPPAQFYNWVEVKTKMWAMNLGKPMKVPQLNEAMAIELGANLLGEFVIFAIGAGLLIVEYVRQVNKEARKEEQIKLEKQQLQDTINELAFRLEKQDTQLRELSRVLSSESKSWFSRHTGPTSESEQRSSIEQSKTTSTSSVSSNQSSIDPPKSLGNAGSNFILAPVSQTATSASPSITISSTAHDLRPYSENETRMTSATLTTGTTTGSSRTL